MSSSTSASTPGPSNGNGGRPLIRRRSTKKSASTSSYLEHLSTVVMESITTSDDIVHYLAEDFGMVHEYETVNRPPVPVSNSLQQHLETMREFKKQWPNWTVRVTDATASLTKGSNIAEVWVSSVGLEVPNNQWFNREHVHVLYWRRRGDDGSWCCYRISSIGSGGALF